MGSKRDMCSVSSGARLGRRERQGHLGWRHARETMAMFIAGVTPEQAAERADTQARNARTSFERQKRG